MALTSGDYDKLTSFIRDETQQSFGPGKRLQASLDEHFDIRINKNLVQMDSKTKAHIRDYLEQENPDFNVKLGLPQQANHMTMSKTMRDEKLGSIKPDENSVLVKALAGKVALTSVELELPNEASLRVPYNQLHFAAYDYLLMVENLDVFDALPDYSLPIKGNVLLVYRGHDKGTSKGVKSLLASAHSHCHICWFPDFDPKGLELAFAHDFVSCILSIDNNVDLRTLKQLSQPNKYRDQSKSVSSLKTSSHKSHPLVALLLKNQLAVMQQHLLTHSIPLKLYKDYLSS